ncbi:hypothetical protein LX99_00386 [Mucilaginibacter oryzae]|uniref:Uncharacterized protein n=1 Tax=Mucilaginibacter oryzae TaxID=468058 RepID=A0A316HNY2_9SPHI|nr:hypothetical protein LX99_00386 [Mucilaginibacter oryzae]
MIPERGSSFVAIKNLIFTTPEGFNLNLAIMATNNTYIQCTYISNLP